MLFVSVYCGSKRFHGLRMSPRILIQKTDLRDFFRRTNPATRESYAKLFGAYMRRAGEPNGKPAQPLTTASAGVRWQSRSFSGFCLVFEPSGAFSTQRPPKVSGLRPWYLTSKPCFPCSGSLKVYSSVCVYLGLGDSFLLGRGGSPSGYCNVLAVGTEVLLVF